MGNYFSIFFNESEQGCFDVCSEKPLYNANIIFGLVSLSSLFNFISYVYESVQACYQTFLLQFPSIKKIITLLDYDNIQESTKSYFHPLKLLSGKSLNSLAT